MKKILISLILILISCVSLGGSAHAAAATPTKVIVTEKIPGAGCVPYNSPTSHEDGGMGSTVSTTTNGNGTTTVTGLDANGNTVTTTKESVYTRKYECTITPGLAGFQQMLATIIKWFINIVMLCAVLAIVGLGIAWSFSGADDAKAKTSLKKWGVNIMVGLVILFFFRYILQFLAPWIYK